MHCPFCQHTDTRVIDSRVSEDGATIRRRRECEACGERFSTLETIELRLPAIIKSDGTPVEVVEINGTRGHLDGVVNIGQAGEAIRGFLDR